MKDGFHRCQSKNLFSTSSTQISLTFHLKPLHFKDRKDASHSLFTKCINWHNYLHIYFYFHPLNIFQMRQDWKWLSHREGLTLSDNKSLKFWARETMILHGILEYKLWKQLELDLTESTSKWNFTWKGLLARFSLSWPGRWFHRSL